MGKKIICFDLEGPLSPQDNAYEVMGLVEDGHKIFEVLSRYDDILALEGREGYEPGDTLSLVVPFLLHHDISEDDIRRVSDKARIVPGADQTIEKLESLGWTPYIISTSYQQHAYNIGEKIGVPSERIYCTRLPLDEFRERLGGRYELVEEVEEKILEKDLSDDEIKVLLDRFYYQDIPETPLGRLMDEISVVGGQRKVDSAESIAKKEGVDLSELMVVGDSITDYKMLERIDRAGGLSVAFNGNSFAVPYAGVALATTDMKYLLILSEAFSSGGAKKAFDMAQAWEEKQREGEDYSSELIPADLESFLIKQAGQDDQFFPHFHLVRDKTPGEIEEIVKIHSVSRGLIRGDAAKLG